MGTNPHGVHPEEPPLGAERSLRRDCLHGVVLTLPWTVIAVLWWRVLAPGGPADLGAPGRFVLACLVLTVALTVAWIAHNVSIYKAKGPRTGLPAVERSYDRDWVGRSVVADWVTVRGAGVVFVAGADRHKTFVAARGTSCRPLGGHPATVGAGQPWPSVERSL